METQRNRENMELLAELVLDGQPHRTGELYAAFLEKSGENIPRKDFLMFLRAQVVSDNGILKRTKFGVYQKRTDPKDRGVVQDRKHTPVPGGGFAAGEGTAAMEEMLDTACGLMEQLTAVLQAMGQQRDLSARGRSELNAIRDSTLCSLDDSISGITAIMAWQEDRDLYISCGQTDGLSAPEKEDMNAERTMGHPPRRSKRGGDVR